MDNGHWCEWHRRWMDVTYPKTGGEINEGDPSCLKQVYLECTHGERAAALELNGGGQLNGGGNLGGGLLDPHVTEHGQEQPVDLGLNDRRVTCTDHTMTRVVLYSDAALFDFGDTNKEVLILSTLNARVSYITLVVLQHV